MKTVEIIKYEAEDGTQFDEYVDCFKYEVEKFHPEIYNVEFYDENNISSHITSKNISNNDDIYNYCQKLIVHNNDELKALRWISEYNEHTSKGHDDADRVPCM